MTIFPRNVPAALVLAAFFMLLPCRHMVGEVQAADNAASKPVIVIDPGHTNRMGGSTSVTGKPEVAYNDAFAQKLAAALARAGFAPVLARHPNQEIKLEERPAVANEANALLMLSIHHDSAQLVHLEPVVANGVKTYRTRRPITGYSIFVSKKNPKYDSSYDFARLLGEKLLKLGRKPTLHHAEAIPGEGRLLLDERLGIYQYDELVVLKKANVPAVLLEVGVIVDQADEAYVTDKGNQERMVEAIVASVKELLRRTVGHALSSGYS